MSYRGFPDPKTVAQPRESDISNTVGTSMFQEHKALMAILEPCRVDLHEPDEQNVYAFLGVTSTSVLAEGYHMPMKIRLERDKLSAEIDEHRLFWSCHYCDEALSYLHERLTSKDRKR